MNLREVNSKISYRTGRDDLVRDFLVPCLEMSVLYRRAAGYFSSSGLSLAARGIASLAAEKGEMRLVVSPHLEPEDVEALQRAIDQPKEVLKSIASKMLGDIEDALQQDRLNAMAWLAAAGMLKVKIAFRMDSAHAESRGLYHEKVGIFTDIEDNHIAFTGSANETAGGMLNNFESVDVYHSWNDPDGRVEEKIQNFEKLWDDTTSGVKTVDFTEVSKNLLEQFRDPDNPPDGLPAAMLQETAASQNFRLPTWFEPRDYQKDAIRAWSEAGGQGILAMATGAGKTLTALTIAQKIWEKNKPLVVVVICPFINLCRQWIKEMAAFGLSPITCFEGRKSWEGQLEHGYQCLSSGVSNVLAIVTTNSTFQGKSFQGRMRNRFVTAKHILIADEVHNLGAEKVQEFLPEEIQMRVGLSATPERHHDPEGTEAIIDYFGGIVYEYSLERAIKEKRLCDYLYHPHLVTLTDDEVEEYEEISTKLSRLLARSQNENELGQFAMTLLIRRARLLASAQNKIEVLDRVLNEMPEKPTKAIFYCGDGRTTDSISDEEVRQIEAVTRMLGEKHDLRVRNFTYRESPAEREEILRDLSSGFLDGVVAIRCLDEGIDLPDLRMGFLLASSTNPRQFVQRRGRLLRHSPGKDRAIIHDFIISPPDLGGSLDDQAYNQERAFFKKELKRIVEFCNTAENGAAALSELKELRLNYGVLAG